MLAEASIIKGGSKGVVAKPSSSSSLSPFAFSMSMGVVAVMSSRLSKILRVGVGGI